MIAFDFNHTNYKQLMQDIASALHLPYTGADFLILTPPAGEGIIKVICLFDELQVMLIDASFDQKVLLTRSRAHQLHFVLHFDDVFIADAPKFSVNPELLQEPARYTAARLTSSIFINEAEIPPSLHVKSIKILFNERWLKKYLGLQSDEEVLKKYLALKTESLVIERLDGEYLKLMSDLWCVQKIEPLHNIFLQNRVTLLMERFFCRLYRKMDLLDGKFDLTDDEVQRLMQVEQKLVSDFSEIPPTIGEFARLVSMSPTLLKKKFKRMYGDSIYSYYQHLRMQKAKEFLISGVFTVKEVSENIGYQNTSNFVQAFKKHFNFAPAELAKKEIGREYNLS